MKEIFDKKISRRSIMKGAVIAGGGAFLGDKLGLVQQGSGCSC